MLKYVDIIYDQFITLPDKFSTTQHQNIPVKYPHYLLIGRFCPGEFQEGKDIKQIDRNNGIHLIKIGRSRDKIPPCIWFICEW